MNFGFFLIKCSEPDTHLFTFPLIKHGFAAISCPVLQNTRIYKYIIHKIFY